jgi:hypothetical protein
MAEIIPFPKRALQPAASPPQQGATLIGWTTADPNALGVAIPIYEGPAPDDAYVWTEGDGGTVI